MTLQDHLGAKTSRPGNGPDTGAGEKQATTAGLGQTDGLGASSCLSDSVDGGGFDGVDGVDGGGFDGVDGGLVASMASMVAW